ncbi:MAG: EAL and modified HD-GYP domain-containing signal transduction protein [Phenylobacterium sp.]|jgi:EAL and modified HD-GYP domain-containing signal transduction protein
MYSYVARQPILDAKKRLFAYELLFRDGKSNAFPDVCPTEATSKLLTQNHLLLGLDELTNGKPAFINFHEDALLFDFPTSLPAADIYVEILEDVPITPELVEACKKLKKLGYQLALDDHDFDPRWDVFLPFVDMIKVDLFQTNILKINKYLRRLKEIPCNPKLKLLAEKVETIQEFEQLKQLGFQYFQGYFFARPEVIKQKSLAPNQLVLMELVSECAKVDMNIDKISELIARDVSLSYKLLRFINSSAFARQKTIGSLKHALIYMGKLELKKFISLISLAKLSDNKSTEVVTQSIVRARFCAQIADYRKDPDDPPMAFLTGLFSLVDALLDLEMGVAVNKLPVCTEIKVALSKGDGDLAEYLNMAMAYEKGEWMILTKLAKKFEVPMDKIGDFYHDALTWANGFENL